MSLYNHIRTKPDLNVPSPCPPMGKKATADTCMGTGIKQKCDNLQVFRKFIAHLNHSKSDAGAFKITSKESESRKIRQEKLEWYLT